MMSVEKLSARQAKFVQEYLLCLNGTEAARRAGYSKKTANREGARLLSNVVIQAAVQAGFQQRQEEFKITEKEIVQELAAIAFFNLKNVMRPEEKGVAMKSWAEMSESTTKAIASVSESQTEFGVSSSVRAHDKIGALKLLGQHIGMWKDASRQQSDSESLKAIHANLRGLLSKRVGNGGGGTSTGSSQGEGGH
jgi:phage terminase small subunit